MRIISAAEVEAALDFTSLVERLRQSFRRETVVPERQHYRLQDGKGDEAALMLMPAWQSAYSIGIRLATIFPNNGEQGLPTVMGAYLLLDGKTGSPRALIDGPTLTLKRTAAASALASRYLSRPDCERLLMVGTGSLAPYLITAHASVRPVCNVLIWGRHPEKAERLAKRLNRRDFRVDFTTDLEAAAKGADIISCATLSRDALIRGAWLQPGQHLDLVGAFRADMRESDDEVIQKSRIFVDTRAGALSDAGDLVQPINDGVFDPTDIAGDFFDMTRGDRAGRRYYDQITLFKSVGTAIEDLAAAQLTVERC